MFTTVRTPFFTDHTRRKQLLFSLLVVCLVCIFVIPTSSQTIRPDMAQTNGSVLTVADGGNVFYIGGTFTNVINPDGSVVVRNRIAAIDASTGYATSWDPGADNDVVVIVPSGSVIYIGGAFLNAGGQSRSRAAAIDAGTGAATAWDPQPNGTVFTMVLSGTTMYMGGAFFQIAGTNRFFLGAVDAGTGALLAWDPSADNFVFSLAQNGSTIYAGGLFLNVGGFGRPRIAAIDAATGVPTAWNPASDNIVLNVTTDGTNVYASGFFTIIGGSGRQGLAALNSATGLATAWNPNCNNGVLRSLVLGSRIIAGGNYTAIGGAGLQNLASLDAVTGASTLWGNPSANGQIEFNGLANVFGDPTVLVGGQFTTIGGQARGFFAVLDQPVPNATYTNTIFTETPSNNGAVGQTHDITLDRTTWLPAPGTVLSTGTHYTVSGVPSGLSVVARVLNTRSVQFFFTGQAQNHAASNSVSNVQLTFTNAAVQNGNAVTIAGLNGQPIRIQFFDSVAAVITPPAAPPRLTDFTPSSGSFGTRVQIRGERFTSVRSVTFGGIPASAFTIESDSLITATVGAGGTGFITLTTPDTTIFSPSAFTYIVNARPVITSISPGTGSLGTPITIYGQGFANVNAVRFGGINVLRFTVDSDNQITAILAEGASGSVSVASPLGEVFLEGSNFTYFAPQVPQILGTTPEPVITGDEDYTLTVIGRNFSFFGQFDVVPLNNPTTTPTKVQVQDISTTSATLRLPLALRRVGAYRLSLRVGDAVLSTIFTVIAVPAPQLTAQSVTSTIASGQAFSITLSGRGFFFKRGAVTLTLNDALAAGQVLSASEATVEIPRELNILGNTARIRLTNYDGQFTEATVRIISRTAPLITDLQPQWYNNADGSPRLEFVIKGAGFMPPLTVMLALRSTPVLRATAGGVTVLIPANFLRPSLAEPPLVLLVENVDSQHYGYRVAPQFFYPVLPQINRYEALELVRRGKASLIGLPIQGTNFQPGLRAMLDTSDVEVLSVQSSRSIVSIPQRLFFPLQSDEPHTITLTNPGSTSTTASVFLRFETSTQSISAISQESEWVASTNTAQEYTTTLLETDEKHKRILANAAIYPNPTQENITIDVSRLQNSAETLILYDVCGRIVLQNDLPPHTDQYTLSLQAFASGFYTLELRTQSIRTRTTIFKL